MTLEHFVRLCRAYRDLGDAVGAQLDDVMDSRPEDANPAALRLLRDWLRAVERQSGNDEELMGEVGGAIQTIEEALS